MELRKSNNIRLICDTSVWYKLADNPEWRQKLNNYILVSTNNSFFEITTASNLSRQTKSSITLKAFDLMCKCSVFIPANPWEFLIEENKLQNKWINDAFNSIRTLTLKENLSDINFDIEPIKSWVNDRKETTTLAANSFNELICKIKSGNELNPGKREIDKLITEYQNIAKAFIEEQVQSFYNTEMVKIVRWENHQYFLKMFTNYIILLVKSEQKQKPNDIGDLYNMVYVKTNDKYLTADKKTWLDLSKRDPITSDQFIYLDGFIENIQ